MKEEQKSRSLTKAELNLMNILWDMGQATVNELVDALPEPKPAYTTVATYLKVLREKGFVDYFKNKGEGKTHQYVAKVTRAEYTRQAMQEVKKDFFGGSIKKMLCFFVEEEHLTAEEIQELIEEVKR